MVTPKQQRLEVEMWDSKLVILYGSNPPINDGDVDAVAAFIGDFGFRQLVSLLGESRKVIVFPVNVRRRERG